MDKLNADIEKMKNDNASMRRYIRLLEEEKIENMEHVPMAAEWPTIMETRVGKLEGAVKTIRENMMLSEARNGVMEPSYASAAASLSSK